MGFNGYKDVAHINQINYSLSHGEKLYFKLSERLSDDLPTPALYSLCNVAETLFWAMRN